MTKFKREVLKKLEQINSDIGFLKGALLQRDGEIGRLERQNRDLMDRIMSIKWESYINQSPDRWEATGKHTETDSSPLTDEQYIGEILADEDLSK